MPDRILKFLKPLIVMTETKALTQQIWNLFII